MAATIHQLCSPQSYGSVISSEEKDWRCQHKHKKSRRTSYDSLWKQYFRDPSHWWDNRSSKAGPAYPDFQHKVTKEFLWVDCSYNPSWAVEELRSRGLTSYMHAQHREPCEKDEKVTLHKPLLCNDEASPFVTALRACTKN
eukprot:c24737_g9_i1 orf=186-608(+)